MLILQGSARSDGDTARTLDRLQARLGVEAERIDLARAALRPFDYRSPSADDGFDAVVERMLGHRTLLFATPVYWYAMSGVMKTLFDRLSDLLGERDPQRRGRRLAGREMWMLAVGTDPEMPEGFDVPFRSTASYLKMLWRGSGYVGLRASDKGAASLDAFARRLRGSGG